MVESEMHVVNKEDNVSNCLILLSFALGYFVGLEYIFTILSIFIYFYLCILIGRRAAIDGMPAQYSARNAIVFGVSVFVIIPACYVTAATELNSFSGECRPLLAWAETISFGLSQSAYRACAELGTPSVAGREVLIALLIGSAFFILLSYRKILFLPEDFSESCLSQNFLKKIVSVPIISTLAILLNIVPLMVFNPEYLLSSNSGNKAFDLILIFVLGLNFSLFISARWCPLSKPLYESR